MNNSNKNKVRRWLENLSDEDRSIVSKISGLARSIGKSESVNISDQEKEDARTQIFNQINTSKGHGSKQKTNTYVLAHWKKAVAAMLILGAGLSYMLIPKTMRAPLGQQKKVILADGTQVQLNSGSEISYSRLWGLFNRDVSLRGEAFFDVSHNKQKPFIVTTKNATVRVTGTKFDVEAWTQKNSTNTVVTLIEGGVTFASRSNAKQTVDLKPGQQSRLSASAVAPAKPKKVATKYETAWLENRFAFEKQSIESIIKELERRFNVTIEVANSDLLNDNLTIYYSKETNIEQIIDDICTSKGLQYRETSTGFLIEKTNN